MRLAFFVNDVATEVDEYTTTRLARAAAQADMRSGTSGSVTSSSAKATGSSWPGPTPRSSTRTTRWRASWTRIQQRDADRIVMDDLDALFLRNESIDDLQERPWASPLPVVLGQMLKARGVMVVNDPMSLDPRDQQAVPGGVPREDPTAIAGDARPGRRSRGSFERSADPSSSRCTEPKAATCS